MEGLTNFQDNARQQGYLAAFLRYSPDGEHWSTWQAMTADAPAEVKAAQPPPAPSFSAPVSVPQRETDAYRKKQREYSKLDVPWVSDEHALCEWIVAGDPEFFANNLPFPGSIQVYIEGSLGSF